MKKILAILFLLFYLVGNTMAQSINKPYEYPIKPGSIEWKQLKSRKEKGDVCQIPSDILKNLTTEALIKTCLNYPLFKDLYFFNDIQTGFDLQKGSFNGFQSLFARNGASVELLRMYKSTNPSDIQSLSSENLKGNFAFQFTALELIISQDEILDKLNKKEKDDLKNLSIEKYYLKQTLDGFGLFGSSSSLRITGKILEEENQFEKLTDNNLKADIIKFLVSGTTYDTSILKQIVLMSK